MHHDLYGSTDRDLDKAKRLVERALGCTLEGHESLYQGGDYYRAHLINGESIVVKRNLDPFDGKPVESEFPRHPVLIYINNTSRSSEIESAFRKRGNSIRLLRHR